MNIFQVKALRIFSKQIFDLSGIVLIGITCLVTTVYAEEKDTITWFSAHWPPLMMLKGEDKGNGRVDMRLQLYKSHLPQYKHKQLEMSWGRFWHDIQSQKKNLQPYAFKKTRTH